METTPGHTEIQQFPEKYNRSAFILFAEKNLLFWNARITRIIARYDELQIPLKFTMGQDRGKTAIVTEIDTDAFRNFKGREFLGKPWKLRIPLFSNDAHLDVSPPSTEEETRSRVARIIGVNLPV